MSENVVGVACRECGCRDCRVTHTEPRQTPSGRRVIRRRRVCRWCGLAFHSVESAEPDDGPPPRQAEPPENPYV